MVGMIERMLPAGTVSVEAFDDAVPAPLFAEEEAVVARAVDKRRREFATVRRCAREALAALEIAPAPILPGLRGAPGWPAGVVGSMTHCDGYRAAVVSRQAVLASVGIDAEPHAPLPEGVLEAVSLPAERVRLAALSGSRPDVHWDRLLFCAKESVYKAWFPLTARWLDFAEASVDFDEAGGFAARLLVPGPMVGGRRLDVLPGRYAVDRGLMITAIALPL
jgi:4'-phosphopantetheinyl transferase EntD